MAKQTFRWKRQSLEPTTSQLIHQLWELFAIETYQVIFRVSRPVKRHVVRNELANLTEGRSRLVIRNAARAHILRPRLILLELFSVGVFKSKNFVRKIYGVLRTAYGVSILGDNTNTSIWLRIFLELREYFTWKKNFPITYLLSM